jgi:hypothetical protein
MNRWSRCRSVAQFMVAVMTTIRVGMGCAPGDQVPARRRTAVFLAHAALDQPRNRLYATNQIKRAKGTLPVFGASETATPRSSGRPQASAEALVPILVLSRAA